MRLLPLIIELLFVIQVNAQVPWLYENSYFSGNQILETYDGGTLIVAHDESQTGPSRLFKLDKTGNVLWEHSFEDSFPTIISGMEEDSEGNIIIGGQTFHYQWDYMDGFLLKLNPCGDILWFRALQENYIHNYVIALTIDMDGNVIVIDYNNDVNNWEYFEDTTLKKYSTDGQLIWSSVLLSESESIPKKVIICSDGGYIVEGSYYAPPYYDQESNIHYSRATIVKTDSQGSFEWRNIYRWEQDTPDTLYNSTSSGAVVEISNGEFMTVAAKKEIPNYRPDLYKINSEGETMWSTDISEDNRTYQNFKMVMDTDSNLILGINVADGNQNYDDDFLEIYKFNQQGEELERWECTDETSLLRDFRWDADSSSLYVMPRFRISSTATLYAFKFNTDSMELDTFLLEDDTEYDFLCPDGVEDRYFNFPELSLDEPIVEEPIEQLKVAPNPGREHTYLYFDIKDYNRSAKLEICNIHGNIMNSYQLQAANGRVKEDLSTYSHGVYIVSLLLNDKVVESSKMIVE